MSTTDGFLYFYHGVSMAWVLHGMPHSILDADVKVETGRKMKIDINVSQLLMGMMFLEIRIVIDLLFLSASMTFLFSLNLDIYRVLTSQSVSMPRQMGQ